MNNSTVQLVISTDPRIIWTTLIGSGALLAGTFSLVLPKPALQVYGVSLSEPTTRTTAASKAQPVHHHRQVQDYEPVLRSLSIRNVTLGLSILTLTAYWWIIAADDPVAARVIRKCLGYIIAIGSVVPAVDAYGAHRDGSMRLKKHATVLHCLRMCAWLVGAVWCLKG